jgi:hypothetical protein
VCELKFAQWTVLYNRGYLHRIDMCAHVHLLCNWSRRRCVWNLVFGPSMESYEYVHVILY